MVDGFGGVEHLDLADGLIERLESEFGEEFPDLLGDVLEERLDELRPAAELLPQHRVLGGHPDRAGVEVADPHHHATGHDKRGGGETELLTAEQGGDVSVSTGLDLAVDLDDDPVPLVVEQQRLLGLGQAQFPGGAGVLDGGLGRGAGSAVVAEMSTTSACAFDTPAATVPTPTSATSFTWMRASGWRS